MQKKKTIPNLTFHCEKIAISISTIKNRMCLGLPLMKLLSITTTASTTDAVLFGYFR